MKCSKCGCELTEGHLYCDKCGEEIRIVPDYEPEIEREMTETLATLFVELAEDTMPELSGDKREDAVPELPEEKTGGTGTDFLDVRTEEEGNGEKKKRKKGKKGGRQGWIIAAIFLFLAAVGAAGAWGNYSYRRMYSVEYQIEQADEAAALKRYAQAISWLEKAYELDPENVEILLRIADYYDIQGQYDKVLSILEGVIQDPDAYGGTEVERAYGKIIAIYREREDYQAINDLLRACDREDIVTEYQQYLAKPPEFSYEGGRYQELLPLKLSANTSGKIYYTLDGTRPNRNSEVYTAPIFLEIGSYIVTAYFVNDYGMESDVVSNTYHIELQAPPAPEVSIDSGDYGGPRMIEVTVPEECTVYYTSDESDPTIDSSRYTAAISMPLGRSVYKFMAVSPEGAVSEITERTYNLELHTDITVDMAVANVIQALMKADVLLDENGKLRGMSGRNVYKYNAVVRIEGSGDYYVIYEYYEDAAGGQSKTERLYGVNIQDGTACRITYDADGKIVLVDI